MTVEHGQCNGSLEVSDLPDPLMVLVRFEYRWAGSGATDPERWLDDVPRVQLDALRVKALPHIPCDRWVPAEVGCTATVSLSHVRASEIPIEARERICPRTRSIPMNPHVAALDPTAIAATLVAERGGWRRSDTPGVYTSDGRQMRITIADMIHECTGEIAPDTMLETEHMLVKFAVSYRVLSATSAVVIEPLYDQRMGAKYLVMWVAGRCRVTVTAPTGLYSTETYADAGKVIDIAALESLCAHR